MENSLTDTNRQYDNPELSDVTLRLHVPGCPIEDIKAHMVLLCLHSSWFRQHALRQEDVNVINVFVKDSECFKKMLQFCYTLEYDYESDHRAVLHSLSTDTFPRQHIIVHQLAEDYGLPALSERAIQAFAHLFTTWRDIPSNSAATKKKVRETWIREALEIAVGIHYPGRGVNEIGSEMGRAIAKEIVTQSPGQQDHQVIIDLYKRQNEEV
ncbi:hypothetical protein BU16DRAFT_532545 [Lophium mytilinum]|uniref:BTB domain-containing protein n=1 Tax=Lophium mytilinum TaxID=390894 RepID=A0A6A6RFB8_9PEZI|nr:hypothetical protein BU16DRAFT_532545 [Lophium mytilinum]